MSCTYKHIHLAVLKHFQCGFRTQMFRYCRSGLLFKSYLMVIVALSTKSWKPITHKTRFLKLGDTRTNTNWNAFEITHKQMIEWYF